MLFGHLPMEYSLDSLSSSARDCFSVVCTLSSVTIYLVLITKPRMVFQSKFEFQLRLQEFIELVRADNNMRAISYARKYLAPWGATHMKELQRVMATLAFRSNTDCPLYKVRPTLFK